MKPTVGRIVHYHAPSGNVDGPGYQSAQPAIVLKAFADPEGLALLRVFGVASGTITGDFIVHAKNSAQPAADCWTWPPRES